MKENPKLSLEEVLNQALGRTYSASPSEAFFTGSGLHSFRNFDSKDNGRRLTIREATRRSTNLVFIRLMRDLVRFHEARLGYNAETILTDVNNPFRHRLLTEIADDEAKQTMLRAYQEFRGLSAEDMVQRLLDKQSKSHRHLAILFYAWHPAPHADVEAELAAWFASTVSQSLPKRSNASLALTEILSSPWQTMAICQVGILWPFGSPANCCEIQKLRG